MLVAIRLMEHSSSSTRTHPRCPSCMDRCSARGEKKGGQHQNSHISHLDLDDHTIYRSVQDNAKLALHPSEYEGPWEEGDQEIENTIHIEYYLLNSVLH